MIREMETHDFRCLRNVTVPLCPLTVLIGPNDSGKSAFLAAVENLIDVRSNFTEGDFWRRELSTRIDLLARTDEGGVDCHAVNSISKGYNASHDHARRSLAPVRRFQLPAYGVPMQCAGYSTSDESELAVNPDGSRVAALLDYLLRRDRKRFFKIVEALRGFI